MVFRGDSKTACGMNIFRCIPKKATAYIMVLDVRIAAFATPIAQHRPSQFLYDSDGSVRKLPVLRGGYLHFCAVYGLPDLLELVSAAVWTCEGDYHGCGFRLVGLCI